MSLILSPLLRCLSFPLCSNTTCGAVAERQMWEILDQTSAVTESHQSAIYEALVCALLGCGWVAREIKRFYGGALCKNQPYIMRACVISACKGVCRHNSGAVCGPFMSERSKHDLKEFKGTKGLPASSLHLYPTWWTAFLLTAEWEEILAKRGPHIVWLLLWKHSWGERDQSGALTFLCC